LHLSLVGKSDRMLPLQQMYQFLRRLLEPAPTSPFDQFRGRDRRSVSEQIVSGLRLAGGLVAGFLVLVLAFGSISTLPAGAPSYGVFGLYVSWSMLCVASIIMLLTTNRWAPYVPGFFFLPGLFKAVGLLLLGPNASSPIATHWVDRTEAMEIVVVCIIVIVLTWRFIGKRPAPTTLLDRVALTFFVLATIRQSTISYHWPPMPLISGLSALLVAWCAYRWERAGRKQKHHHENSTVFDTPPDR
jgi:heme A synthase